MRTAIASSLAVGLGACALAAAPALAAESPFTNGAYPANDQYNHHCPPQSGNGQGGQHGNGNQGNGNGNGKKCGQPGSHAVLGVVQMSPSSGSGSGSGLGATNGSSSASGSASASRLPFTGADWVGLLVVLGVSMIAVGSLVLAGTRARRRLWRLPRDAS